MKNIILCEGKTDAILLSYYLSKVCGWEFLDKKENRRFKARLSSMKIDNAGNQNFDWYFCDNDILCIYAVGSKDNFSDALEQVAAINLQTSSEKFSKVALISDRDDLYSESIILKAINQAFSKPNINFKNILHNTWNESDGYESMGETYRISILPLIIPF